MSGYKSFVQFVCVGLIATAVQYVLLVWLVRQFGMPGTLASALGFACSALLNYALNRRFSFASDRPHSEALPRFMVVAGSGLALNTVVFWCMQAAFASHILISQVVATAVVLVWNFLLHQRWTFAKTG
ncbi:MAG: GtrA family protein [Proteobacteria bacterium]|nr:GtrA family protein [Pseudomonadota bacterium]